MNYTRRKFLLTLPPLATIKPSALFTKSVSPVGAGSSSKFKGAKIKISLNAYSFNKDLRAGQMNLDDLLEFCAELNFDAVDITGYYFPGYPIPPSDKFLNHIKRKAFLLGLDISGTGIKNDFTDPDINNRKKDILLIRQWIDCAAKLGAPVLRVFAGKQSPEGYTRVQITDWMIEDLKVCAAYGEKMGVIVAIQNHNDFIKTADQTINILKLVGSKWFGLVLDIGSLRTTDPYEEIARLAPYAVNWQIKEFLYRNGHQEKTDVKKIIQIIKDAGYRGYIPLETLGPGDPKEKIKNFLIEVRTAL